MGGKADLLNKMCMAAGECVLGTLVNQMITLENELRTRVTDIASIVTVYGVRINDLRTGLTALASTLSNATSPTVVGATVVTLLTSTVQPVGAAVALTLVTSTLYGMASAVSTI